MEIQRADTNFRKDYSRTKRESMKEFNLWEKTQNPIKNWQSWIDLDIGNIKDLTDYLLQGLVFNPVVTSITSIIPLVQGNDLKVGVSLFLNEENIYKTYDIKTSFTPMFVSTNDLVTVLNELIEENKDNCQMRYAYHKLAWKLHIIDELKERQK